MFNGFDNMPVTMSHSYSMYQDNSKSSSWGLDTINPNNKVMNKSLSIDYVDQIPKQDNSYDCGIYVMSFAEAIALTYV